MAENTIEVSMSILLSSEYFANIHLDKLTPVGNLARL